MRDIVKPALILFVTCLVVVFALAFTYSVTQGAIAARGEEDAENARKAVMTTADSFKAVDGLDAITKAKPEMAPVKEAYKGLKGDSAVGYVFKTTTKGYGGDIIVTVGVDSKGAVTGVKVGDNKETPGLGSKAADKSFSSQYEGGGKDAFKVIKVKKSKPEEIEAISGATITSKAVTTAVQAAVDCAKELAGKEGAK